MIYNQDHVVIKLMLSEVLHGLWEFLKLSEILS